MELGKKQAHKVEAAAALPRKQEGSGILFAWPFTHFFRNPYIYYLW